MKRALLIAATATALLAEPAASQSYDPNRSGSGSPLSLLDAPADGLAYHAARDRARQLYNAKKWSEAEPLLEAITKQYPRDPENWFRLGEVKRRLGKPLEAAAAYEKAIPMIGWANVETNIGYKLVGMYLAAGQKQKALDTLRTVIFQHKGFWRNTLDDKWAVDADLFASIVSDPEFQEIIGHPDTRGWSRLQGWRYDLDYLHDEVMRINPAYHGRKPPLEFERRYAALRKSLGTLSDEQIFYGMQRMLAVLHQGHTELRADEKARTENPVLPVKFYAFPEGLFIIDADDDYRGLIGQRVSGIGSLTADEALRRLSQARSVDGDMEYVFGANSLVESYYLKGMGAVPLKDRAVALRLEKPGEASRQVVLPLVPQSGRRLDRLVAPKTAPAPLYLGRIDDVMWQSPMPDHDAIYVQLNRVLNDKNQTMDEFGQALWAEIGERHPKNLIFDLRHNNGGVSQWYPGLLRALIAFSQDPEHRLFVLIGRRTYSAAANLITDLERLADPVFVGEASGECCNLHGDPIRIILPYSQIRGSLSMRDWGLTSPWDERRELSPDIPVQLTAKAYFAGQDPALEAIFKLIDSGASITPSDHLLSYPR